MVEGNITGVKNSILNKLDDLYNVKTEKNVLANIEIIEAITSVTNDINREISVAIDRKGKVLNVSIGDSGSVHLPLLSLKEKKLSGVKIIHTHPNGNPLLSAIDLSALIQLKLDAIAAIGIENGNVTGVCLGYCNFSDNVLTTVETAPLDIISALNINIAEKVEDIENFMKNHNIIEDDTEKAILVGIESEESLDELKELASACNVYTVQKVLQKRTKVDSALFVGKGKVTELAMLRQAEKADLIIFDEELSASQIRNLEELTGCKVIDRTILILEIFAKRAKSRESKIQIELAQLKYRLPRLSGLGTILSRTGAGIGTRGPGEKKLEIDKRRIRERIFELTKELQKVKSIREVQRNKRTKDNIPKVSLVGYTNTGKSTLRNTLCSKFAPNISNTKEKVFEADMLFATLDVTTRAINLPDNRLATLTDTVGFVKKLPHDLIEAFKSTLEEVINSDLLVHVIDIASSTVKEDIEAVWSVLKELEAFEKPLLLAFNKIDKIEEKELLKLKEEFNEYIIVPISALKEENLDLLMETITELLPASIKEYSFLIPYDKGTLVSYIHNNSKILQEDYKDNGTYIKAMVDPEMLNKLEEYLFTEENE
ncbi:GTPase HflX [Clostridium grantii]|uniref:GTPase HflX n=1 Tax=Clostridium grantii DSM 8605 TaxID=1121316 RepID=A0A1M5SLN8_9CLOT|nr:GTPase HflX [Clostridium grantii]SHH39168.1 GTP-binding protein HflX [Clostridium grantii DSM 8605]